MVMSDHSPEVFACPGCGRSVEPGEDYVVALEYDAEPGFSLHQMNNAVPVTAERRSMSSTSEGNSATVSTCSSTSRVHPPQASR